MKKFPILLLLTACWSLAAAQERPQVPAAQKRNLRTEIIAADSTGELLAQLRNMPNIEIGKGITFRPKNDWFELTMRFRMQNLLALSFDDDFTLTKTEARVKRLRLRFDGYIYSPKLVYSVQLGFTSYDTEPLPGGDMNIVRDAIVYYVPNATWNIGFGQTKIKANRARINSSSALQFVDRSIVNSEFNLDRDFGFFGDTTCATARASTSRQKAPSRWAKAATGAVRRPEGWPIRGVWNSIRWDASSRRATSSRATTNSRSG